MALVLTIILFLTIVLVVFSFGAAAYAPSSVLGSRLRAAAPERAVELLERLDRLAVHREDDVAGADLGGLRG